jgi:hypothetical protein
MNLKSLSVLSATAVLACSIACEKSPARPTAVESTAASASAATDARTGVTLTSPVILSPAENAPIKFGNQPIPLVIRNAVTTGRSALTYTFEVATDSGFGSMVFSKDNVSQGANGQTSFAIDKLPGDKVYYWRARSNSRGTAGPNTRTRAFSIGPEATLQTPDQNAPADNGTAPESPVLSVNNVQRSGPTGQISYHFEISEQQDFSSIVYSGNEDERSDQRVTSHTVQTRLDEKSYFWRVQAIDSATAVTTPFSNGRAFRVQLFNLHDATIVDNPQDLANWAETAAITRIDFTPSAMIVDFNKRTGPGKWPESGFGNGGIQYTLGMCLNINAHWYCSAPIQFWDGRDLEASGLPSQVGINWFYDNRWGPMKGHQPRQGEIVGFFVGQGNLRDNGKTSVKERSNVVLLPFGGSYRP